MPLFRLDFFELAWTLHPKCGTRYVFFSPGVVGHIILVVSFPSDVMLGLSQLIILEINSSHLS